MQLEIVMMDSDGNGGNIVEQLNVTVDDIDASVSDIKRAIQEQYNKTLPFDLCYGGFYMIETDKLSKYGICQPEPSMALKFMPRPESRFSDIIRETSGQTAWNRPRAQQWRNGDHKIKHRQCGVCGVTPQLINIHMVYGIHTRQESSSV